TATIAVLLRRLSVRPRTTTPRVIRRTVEIVARAVAVAVRRCLAWRARVAVGSTNRALRAGRTPAAAIRIALAVNHHIETDADTAAGRSAALVLAGILTHLDALHVRPCSRAKMRLFRACAARLCSLIPRCALGAFRNPRERANTRTGIVAILAMQYRAITISRVLYNQDRQIVV